MKWKLSFYLIISISILGYSQKIDESESIKSLLEKESATWRAADSKGHTECWYIQPYSRILVSTAEGVTIDVPPTAMIDTNPSAMGNGGFSVNTNYKMSIHENNAWVSHDEESTAKDGKKTFSYEIRLLEKIEGQWKLVGQSIHIYKPK
ncbi:endo-arabinase [Flavobacterium gawalongense]|uniref:Endo-arabinase n=1 Tax=Flavobacterium gawalongense TaxID=2594432 RepID=A0A553BRD0_9FLAO|nr:endo-arabinase [Flavobacterium gawalongense]TRX10818.1 endo-arabinase [Flavobacterium gawalongense]TRX11540.1 endo-arabinase [Flavobacterium gawalongense]TRX29310.1 endo-arabinase [Flavobacterium gawalongense]